MNIWEGRWFGFPSIQTRKESRQATWEIQRYFVCIFRAIDGMCGGRRKILLRNVPCLCNSTLAAWLFFIGGWVGGGFHWRRSNGLGGDIVCMGCGENSQRGDCSVGGCLQTINAMIWFDDDDGFFKFLPAGWCVWLVWFLIWLNNLYAVRNYRHSETTIQRDWFRLM